MDGVNEPDENGKVSNLLDPDAEKQTFGRKSQNQPNLRDENFYKTGGRKHIYPKISIRKLHALHN
ncbi:hypothetical protein Hanom_Chr07g00676861 [Helianthus anomalus]